MTVASAEPVDNTDDTGTTTGSVAGDPAASRPSA